MGEEDSGFSLNISSSTSSGGAVRRVGKKKSTFRSKKRNQKNKKAASNGNGTSAITIDTLKPRPQAKQQSRPLSVQTQFSKVKKPVSARATKPKEQVAVATQPLSSKSDDNQESSTPEPTQNTPQDPFASDDDEDLEELSTATQRTIDPALSCEGDENDDEPTEGDVSFLDDMIKKVKADDVLNDDSDSAQGDDDNVADVESEANHKQADDKDHTTTTTTSTTTTDVQMTTDDKKKGFGTRKNPNKENYTLETHTKVRTTIAHVHEAPLASASSEQIFAVESFDALKLDPRLVQVLQGSEGTTGSFNFDRPTRVQVQSVPLVLRGRDVLIKSETGSGKTLSYLLPIVQSLAQRQPRVERADGCLALILAPTRELCQQILETLTKLLKPFHYIVPSAVVGGEKKKSEKARFRKGINVLIATPGRLMDHLQNTRCFNYQKLQFLVLDEADRLLDMGFEVQIKEILRLIGLKKEKSLKRQNILVSATINSGIEQLAAISLTNPALIDADTQNTKASSPDAEKNETFNTPHQLMQHFMIVPAKARLCALSCFLRHEMTAKEKCKVVVFLSTCDAVDFHYALFGKCNWPGGDATSGGDTSSLFGQQGTVFRLHGSISQTERMTTFKRFCASSTGVLLCTDVAARGLNLPTVQWIVQYDPPTETRDYVHRVGRTARSGNQGSSLLFLMPSESEYLDHLRKHGLEMNALSLEKCITRAATTTSEGGGSVKAFKISKKKLFHEVIQSDLQYLFEQTLLADADLFESACQAFHSFVRSYATHSSDTRKIFHVRSLHFGHIAKAFALREPPASTKVRDTGRNAKKGTLHKRKEREDRVEAEKAKKMRYQKQQKRKYAQQISEFAG